MSRRIDRSVCYIDEKNLRMKALVLPRCIKERICNRHCLGYGGLMTHHVFIYVLLQTILVSHTSIMLISWPPTRAHVFYLEVVHSR